MREPRSERPRSGKTQQDWIIVGLVCQEKESVLRIEDTFERHGGFLKKEILDSPIMFMSRRKGVNMVGGIC